MKYGLLITFCRYGDVASAQTISTYPTIPDFGRSGDPICDRFYVHVRISF